MVAAVSRNPLGHSPVVKAPSKSTPVAKNDNTKGKGKAPAAKMSNSEYYINYFFDNYARFSNDVSQIRNIALQGLLHQYHLPYSDAGRQALFKNYYDPRRFEQEVKIYVNQLCSTGSVDVVGPGYLVYLQADFDAATMKAGVRDMLVLNPQDFYDRVIAPTQHLSVETNLDAFIHLAFSDPHVSESYMTVLQRKIEALGLADQIDQAVHFIKDQSKNAAASRSRSAANQIIESVRRSLAQNADGSNNPIGAQSAAWKAAEHVLETVLRTSVFILRVTPALEKLGNCIRQGLNTANAARELEKACNSVADWARATGKIAPKYWLAFRGILKLGIIGMVVGSHVLNVRSNHISSGPGVFRELADVAYGCGCLALFVSAVNDLAAAFSYSPAARAQAVELVSAASNTSARVSEGVADADLEVNALSTVEREVEAGEHITDNAINRAVEDAARGERPGARAVADVTVVEQDVKDFIKVEGLIGKTAMQSFFGLGDILGGISSMWQGAVDINKGKKVTGGLEVASGTLSVGSGILLITMAAIGAPVLSPWMIGLTFFSAAGAIASIVTDKYGQ